MSILEDVLAVCVGFAAGIGVGWFTMWQAQAHPEGIFGRLLEDKDDTGHSS